MAVPNWLRIHWQSVGISATIFGSSLIGSIFRLYYVRVFLERYGLSVYWLNFAQTFFIISNIIVEPLLGFLQDFGCRGCRNRRRLILFSGPFSALIFLGPWFPWYNPGTAPAWLPGLHLILVLFFWNLFFVLVGSSYSGLYAEQSTDHVFRVRLFKYETLATLLGTTVVFPVDKLSHSLRDYGTFQICTVVIAVVAAAAFVITGLTASDVVAQVQRLPEETENEENSQTEPLSSGGERVLEALKVAGQIFRNRDFVCAVGANFCGWMRNMIFYNFLTIYTEILVPVSIMRPGSFQIAAFYAYCNLIPLVVLAASTAVTRRMGCFWTVQASFLLSVLNSALALLLHPWLGYSVMIAQLLIEAMLSKFSGLYHIILSEVIDEDTKLHRRRLPVSTLIYTLNGMVCRSSVGLAPIVVVQLLQLGGFREGQPLTTPSESLRRTAFLVGTCLPAFLGLLAFFVMLPYRIRRRDEGSESEATEDVIDNDDVLQIRNELGE